MTTEPTPTRGAGQRVGDGGGQPPTDQHGIAQPTYYQGGSDRPTDPPIRSAADPGTPRHDTNQEEDPRSAVAALADSIAPYAVGVRHHSPALAAVLPALLDSAGIDVLCVELPTDFQPWLGHLADPATVAPVALAGASEDGRLGFYPFADFSPELAGLRWASQRGVEVLCCDLPLSDPAWSADADPTRDGTDPGPGARSLPGFADALAASGTGRAGEDLWDRSVEVLAPGCTPDAVRRAALGVGWALRRDAQGRGGPNPTDLAREAHMRRVLAEAADGGRRRVAALVGAFHVPALIERSGVSANRSAAGPAGTDPAGEGSPRTVHDRPGTDANPVTGPRPVSSPAAAPTSTNTPGPRPPDSKDRPGGARRRPGQRADRPGPAQVTSLVPYAFDLLDARSGYPAGIRDPRWQQAVFTAAGDPEAVRVAAARAITDLCRQLRAAGHTAGTGEAAETLRVADDLARLRALPAPGRGELLEAVTSVLGQGEPLGRGRALAQALQTVLVGAERGRITPDAPRSGLGPCVEAELVALRLPGPHDPEPREVRLDPLRSDLDRRREVLLQRLSVCGVTYGQSIGVTGTGDAMALTTRWRLSWTPSVAALLDLAGVRGVTAAQAASGTLRNTYQREADDPGVTSAQILRGLRAAAQCDLPDLVAERLADAAEDLPANATLPELLEALDLLDALRREHLPGTTPTSRTQAAELAAVLVEAAVRTLPGLAGSEQPADASALVGLSTRAGDHHLGLRMDAALTALAERGSPLIQGAALAARTLFDLDRTDTLGVRVASWVDSATNPEGRRRLTRLLTGLLVAAGPLLQSSPAALDPLLDRIDRLTDQDFLTRLPALRGGFDTLAPAARDRLLHTVGERLGDQVDVTLDAPPELMAVWTAADAVGRAALDELWPPPSGPSGRPAPATNAGPGRPVDHTGDTGRRVTEQTPGTALRPAAGAVLAAPGTATTGRPTGHPAEAQAHPADAGPAAALPPSVVAARDTERPTPRLAPADRWRLLLGREGDRLPATARRYAHALDELYGAGRGEGAADFGRRRDLGGGGRATPFPTARDWAGELDALFGHQVRQEVLGEAADIGRTDVLAEIDPDAVRPSVELLTSVLSLVGGMPEQQLSRLRPLVRRLVAELTKELASRMKPAMTGLATPRPTRRPGGRLDLPRTLRANLDRTQCLDDGRTLVVPERPVFQTRSRRQVDWRLILVVDVSGSMEASVVWAALTAAVLGGVPALSTHFLAFSTQVIDLTKRVPDPLSLLLEVRVGGGTHIAAGLAHARTLVTVPSRTLMVVVSDFEEGYPVGGLLAEVRSLASSGVHLLGCAALNDDGKPRYSVPTAQKLVAAGMPVAALSPLALARWVGDRLRGEPR